GAAELDDFLIACRLIRQRRVRVLERSLPTMTPKLVRVFAFFQPYCKTDARCRRNSENFRKLASDLPQLPPYRAPQRTDGRSAAYHCAVVAPRSPTTSIVGCCARAASGHATAAPPRSVMNSRRLTRSPRRRGREA